MRILVTGHHGYIGTLLVPLAQKAGHEVVGLDSDMFAPCVFGDRARRDRVDPQGRPRRRGRGPRGLRRRPAPGRGLQRPGRQPQPAGHLRHQPDRLGADRGEGQAGGRRALRLLLVVQPVRQGAGPTRSTRRPASRRRRRTASPRCWPSRTSRRSPTTTFSPTYLRNATAYGVSPRLRLDVVVNNLVGWAHTTGEIVLQSDGTPWRPLVHIEDISRAALAVLEAPREKSTTRPSTSAPPRRTTRSARSPRSSPRSPARPRRSPTAAASPTRAPTASTAPSSPASCRTRRRSGRSSAAPRSSTAPTASGA